MTTNDKIAVYKARLRAYACSSKDKQGLLKVAMIANSNIAEALATNSNICRETLYILLRDHSDNKSVIYELTRNKEYADFMSKLFCLLYPVPIMNVNINTLQFYCKFLYYTSTLN